MPSLGSRIFEAIHPVPSTRLGSTFSLATYNDALAQAIREVFDAGIGKDVNGFTQGSIPFAEADGTLEEDNANLFYDDPTNQLRLGGTLRVGPTRTLSDNSALGATTFSGSLLTDFDVAGGALYFDTTGERYLTQSNPGTVEMIARLRSGEKFAVEMYNGITKGAEDRKWEVTPTGATWLGSTNTILWAASAASAGATLRDSPSITVRGTSWSGSASDSRNWSGRVRPTSATTYLAEEGWSLASPIRSVDELGIVRHPNAIRIRLGADPTNDFGHIQGVAASPGFYFEKTANVQHFYALIDGNNLVVFTALKGGSFLFSGSTDATLGRRGMIYGANPPITTGALVGHSFGTDFGFPAGASVMRVTQGAYTASSLLDVLWEGGLRTFVRDPATVGYVVQSAASQTADLLQFNINGASAGLAVTKDMDLVPGADASRNIGTDSLRFSRVRAVDVVSGDLSFDDEGCDVCEEPFASGQVLALRVTDTETDAAGRLITHTVPIHLGCAGEC